MSIRRAKVYPLNRIAFFMVKLDLNPRAATFALIALVASLTILGGTMQPAYAVLSGSKTVKLYLQKDASV